MKTRIHVNQHNIKANAKDGGDRPVITAKTYKSNSKGQTAMIMDGDRIVAKIVYRPAKPLSCGAKCWVETELKVTVES